MSVKKYFCLPYLSQCTPIHYHCQYFVYCYVLLLASVSAVLMWKGSMIQVDLVWHFFSTYLQGNKYMEYLPAIQNHGLNLFRYQFIIKLDHPNFGQWFYLGEDFLMSMSWILISLSSPSLIYRTHHTSNLSLMKSSTHELTVKIQCLKYVLSFDWYTSLPRCALLSKKLWDVFRLLNTKNAHNEQS